MNNLILVCPDGGTNGNVSDPIDYGFTTELIDSMKTWYNIDLIEFMPWGSQLEERLLMSMA